MNPTPSDRPPPAALADLLPPLDRADLRGLSRLAIDGVLGVTDTVESMHQTVSSVGGLAGDHTRPRTSGLTGLVYGAVRGTTRLTGHGLDLLLRALPARGPDAVRRPAREGFVAALNGVWGDHLVATGNPLAIPMTLRVRGVPVEPGIEADGATGRVLLLLHGLAMNDLQWRRNGHEHGEMLAAARGLTPVHVHYNSGRHVSENGRELAGRLSRLVDDWPVPVDELVVLAHSMGGLVARSAVHLAEGSAWRRRLSTMVFLGTPHHGAPLERGGHLVDQLLESTRWAAPIARLGRARSAGITDLRFGNVRDEDWGQHPERVSHGRDTRIPVPLPEGVACHVVAATRADSADALSSRTIGDGLVPVPSALGVHRDPTRDLGVPADRRLVVTGANHWDLLDRADVRDALMRWIR